MDGDGTQATSETELLKERIRRLERQHLEQEHRLAHVVWNLLKHGLPGSTHQHRSAVRWALVWRVFSPSSAVIVAGGIAAWLTLWEIHLQTAEIRKQTIAFSEQNKALIAQNKKFDDQLRFDSKADYEARKAQLLSVIYDTEQRWPWSSASPRASDRARGEAAASYYRLLVSRGEDVVLERANLTGALISGVDLTSATLTEALFSGANLSGSTFASTKLIGADLTGATLYKADLTDADLSVGKLAQARLGYATMVGANFRSADLTSALIERADLSGANLVGATLVEAVLCKAKLCGADISAADLSRANLREANLSSAVLYSANLSGADLAGAELDGADLEDAILLGIQYGKGTVWPAGFDPPPSTDGFDYDPKK